MTSTEEIKAKISAWMKSKQVIESPLGDVVLDERLGEGATAYVYSITRPFSRGVIKLLAENIESSITTRYLRFRDEYVNLIPLSGTGAIVPLYFYGVTVIDSSTSIPYILMERCETTFHELYKEERCLTEQQFRQNLDQLLDALKLIHDRRIIHRDVKPRNILMRESGSLVLADFGIAWFDPDLHVKAAMTRPRDRMANAQFSPPDQSLPGAKPAPHWDLFALGQSMYYSVAGTTIVGADHTPMAKFSKELAKYDPIISRLAHSEPLSRFQSVSEVQEELQNIDLFKEARDKWYREDDAWYRKMRRQVEKFDDRLEIPLLNWEEYQLITDPLLIQRVLKFLSRKLSDDEEVWWRHYSVSSGMRDNVLNSKNFKLLKDGIWLIDTIECQISSICIHRNRELERQYVVLELKPMPPFFEKSKPVPKRKDKAGFAQGMYIPYEEYEKPSRYLFLNGKRIDTFARDHGERSRFLTQTYLFLAPKNGLLFFGEDASSKFRETSDLLHKTKRLTSKNLRLLEGIERDFKFRMYD